MATQSDLPSPGTASRPGTASGRGAGPNKENPIVGASTWFRSSLNSPEYSLHILQQPVRARMCGFGDRDRRIITPPIIVQLNVRDAKTKQAILADDVDVSFFILNADLWREDMTQEVNMVMHPAFSPEGGARGGGDGSSSYAQQPQWTPPQQQQQQQQQQPLQQGAWSGPAGAGPAPPAWPGAPQGGQWRPSGVSPQMRPTLPPISALTSQYPSPAQGGYPGQAPSSSTATGPEAEMSYTRNLIGALAQNAYKLLGTDGQQGIFFIFHDLSIRTEGVFRLRLSFVSIAVDGVRTEASLPVLAEIFTNPFQVFSAKKFPGMIQPSPLLKHFQLQGVRVPMRTNYRHTRSGQEQEGEDAEEEEEE